MKISRAVFDGAVEAVWSEIEYLNCGESVVDEITDLPGFLTLLRRYLRSTEDDWVDAPGPPIVAEHGLRKIAATALRAMISTTIRVRGL